MSTGQAVSCLFLLFAVVAWMYVVYLMLYPGKRYLTRMRVAGALSIIATIIGIVIMSTLPFPPDPVKEMLQKQNPGSDVKIVTKNTIFIMVYNVTIDGKAVSLYCKTSTTNGADCPIQVSGQSPFLASSEQPAQ